MAITLGSGPVYPVMGFKVAPPAREGVVHYVNQGHPYRRSGWYYHKVLWARSPDYPGPALVRGRRIDGAGRVRFQLGEGEPSRPELRFSSARTRRWEYAPSAILLRRSGCYAFQIEGKGFRRVVVFEAVP